MNETIEKDIIDHFSNDLKDDQDIILDVELDPLIINLMGDDIIEIQCKNYTHITLDIETINKLLTIAKNQ